MSALRRFKISRRIGARALGAAMILPLPAAGSARADIITMADIARGVVMTQAQCAAIPQAAWVNALGRNFACMRFLSFRRRRHRLAASGVPARRFGLRHRSENRGLVGSPPGSRTPIPTIWSCMRTRSPKQQKTTAIYLARMGRDGSSGWHKQRHAELGCKPPMRPCRPSSSASGSRGFNVYGHSGGGNLVGGLLTMRNEASAAPYRPTGCRWPRARWRKRRTRCFNTSIPPPTSPPSRRTVQPEFSWSPIREDTVVTRSETSCRLRRGASQGGRTGRPVHGRRGRRGASFPHTACGGGHDRLSRRGEAMT